MGGCGCSWTIPVASVCVCVCVCVHARECVHADVPRAGYAGHVMFLGV